MLSTNAYVCVRNRLTHHISLPPFAISSVISFTVSSYIRDCVYHQSIIFTMPSLLYYNIKSLAATLTGGLQFYYRVLNFLIKKWFAIEPIIYYLCKNSCQLSLLIVPIIKDMVIVSAC